MKIPRIGYLNANFPSANPARIEAFRQGLRELGYVEGKNIVTERRFADGKFDRLPSLASELVRFNVAVILTTGGISTRAAKEATSTIPIVMAQDNDPVGNGFVASLARPGGNITGLATFAPELSAKRLELLKEIVPKLFRVAVFGTSANPGNAQSLKEIEAAAGTFKIQLQQQDVLESKDIEPAFRAAANGRIDTIIVLVSSVLNSKSQTGRRTCGKEPAPGDLSFSRICRSWRADELRREFCRLVPALRHVRRQNPERRQARRSSGGAAHEVRVRGQSQGREADWPDDSAECAGAGGQSDPMIERSKSKSKMVERFRPTCRRGRG
jgi:hypothetical protein